MRKIRRCLVAFGLVLLGILTNASADPLSLEARVQHQIAIERVYWNHRIWPAENPSPKPTLEQVLTPAVVVDRVEDYLAKSAALEIYWHRPVTPEQLRAELERIARSTQDPTVLRELFQALRNDPVALAECLARPVLTDRLIRSWYARDERMHGNLKATALVELGNRPSPSTMKFAPTGQYRETLFLRGDPTKEAPAEGVVLEDSKFNERIEALRHQFSGSSAELPQHMVSALTESDTAFEVTAVLEYGDGRLRLATTTWRKRDFDEWWHQARRAFALSSQISSAIDEPTAARYGSLAPTIAGDSCTVPDTWLRSSIPSAREQHVAVWTGSEMIVWGGFNTDGYSPRYLGSGYRYNPATNAWTPIRDFSVAYKMTAVWTGTEMIVWGGLGPIFLDRGGRYNPVNDTWTPTSMGTGVPSGRYDHTAVWTGSEMIVWGGVTGSVATNSGGRYSPTTDSWTPTSVTGGVPSARSRHSAVWSGGQMIIWGGLAETISGTYVNDGARYDAATDTWVAVSIGSHVPDPRARHTAVWTGSRMIVWGGEDAVGLKNTGGIYNPASDSWIASSLETGTGANTPSARHYHTAIWTDSEMLVWGGDDGVNRLASGGRYEPSTDTWQATSPVNAPTGRIFHTAVWTGSEMIVWGGTETDGWTNTGGRYAPLSDSWISTKNSKFPPERRKDHTAVWTGAEMIVWGGSSGAIDLNSGSRYQPATDAWTPTSTGANVPTPQSWHTAIWTGTEMIVWGLSGGRYSPVANSWSPISAGAGAPGSRTHHSAVWTGAEMIVWGGVTTGIQLNTGARYTPTSDSWIATANVVDTPTARQDHAAVWTGSRMIVWGGYTSSSTPNYLNTGALYNPNTDSWSPTSTGANAPVGQRNPSGLWSGTEMLIQNGWGVDQFGSVTGFRGGRYDPIANTWRTMSCFWYQRYASAIWTGTEAIYWGGQGYSSPFEADGGIRYDPVTDTSSFLPSVDRPDRRSNHSTAWTGHEMIVFGGQNGGPGDLDSMGRLCLCVSDFVWYRDADGDGFGNINDTITACSQPGGYVTSANDCDDSNPHCTADCTDVDGDTWCQAFDSNDVNPHCWSSLIDSDVDGWCTEADCNDSSAAVWAVPGETRALGFAADKRTLSWSAPLEPGGTLPLYDSLRSTAASDFVGAAMCVETQDSGTVATDPLVPATGNAYFYLTRGRNTCGVGTLGKRSSGAERLGRECELAATYWARYIASASSGEGRAVQALPEGGFVVAGLDQQFGNPWLISMSDTGEVRWQALLGLGDIVGTPALSMRTDPTGDILLAVTGLGVQGVSVLKVNHLTGNVVWRRDVTAGAGGRVYLPQVVDWGGDIAVVGASGSASSSNPTKYIAAKLAANGTVQWQYEYSASSGPFAQTFAVAVNPLASGELLLATSYTASVDRKPLLMKLGPTGNIVWQKVFSSGGVNGSLFAVSCRGPANPDCVAVGGYAPGVGSNPEEWVVKFTTGGTIRWQKRFSGRSANRLATGVLQTPAGEIVVAGSNFSTEAEVFRLDSQGALLHQTMIGDSSVSMRGLSDVAREPDGSLLLAGSYRSFGSFYDSLWVSRTNPDGVVSPSCSSAATFTPIVTSTPTVAGNFVRSSVVGNSVGTWTSQILNRTPQVICSGN